MTIAFAPTLQAEKYIRPLLPRTYDYVVPTTTLIAYIGTVIVREQFTHCVEQTVEWSLAQFDVRTATGDAPHRSAEVLASAIADKIDGAVGDDEASLEVAIRAVHDVLLPVFGQRLRVTGWLPGHHVAEGRTLLFLNGDACPRCTVNPATFVPGDRTRTLSRCLNSEDCGWTS